VAITYVGGDDAGGQNVTTIDLTWPTVAAGDYALVSWSFTSSLTPTDPSGFALASTSPSSTATGNNSHGSRVISKVCTGSESGTFTLTTSGSNRQSAVLLVYRGVDPTTPIDDIDNFVQSSSTTSHACTGIVTTVPDAVVVTTAAERVNNASANWTQPSGYTERIDTLLLAQGTGGTDVAGADDGLASGRAAGTSVTPSNWTNTISTNTAITWTIALRPLVLRVPPVFSMSAVHRAACW